MRLRKSKITAQILVVLCLVIFGIASLIDSHAATFSTSVQTENGTITGNALSTSNSSASGGKAVAFGQTPSNRTQGRWILANNLLKTFGTDDHSTALWFFDTPSGITFSTAVPGFAATTLKNYKSFAQFSSDIANNAIPSDIHWVLYDNENWSYTPVNEAQHPSTYMKNFADLAHAHNLKVMETPARDLMSVANGDCTTQSGETIDHAYIRCQIPLAAQYADIYEIQAQADQPNVTTYENFVTDARNQIITKKPGMTITAGLTTDRGDSATQIFNCWNASHMLLAGYWMNSQSASLSIAEQVMDMVKASGG